MSDTERVQRWRQRQRQAGKDPLTIWLTTAEKLRLEDQALMQRCSPSELVHHALALVWGESPPVTDTVADTEQLRATHQHEPPLAQTVTDIVTATLQQTLPGLVRALMDARQAGNVTATVTDTVTDTSTAPGEDPRPEAAPVGVADTVADTVTDTVVLPMTYPVAMATTDTVVVPMAAPVTATVTDTTPAPPAKRKAPSRHRVTDTVADTVADTVTVTEAKHRGRKPVLRPGILALLDEHPDGLTAAELKVYLQTEKPIGDTLAGMVKAELLVKTGTGQGLRYQRAGAGAGL